MDEDAEVRAIADEAARTMATFAVPLATGLVKLRASRDAGTGAHLRADEVRAIMEALQLLRGATRANGVGRGTG